MQTSRLTTATAPLCKVLSAVLCLSACRSARHEPAALSGRLQPDPSIAAQEFFTRHYDFYYEDPARCEALLTPRLYRALKHHYDAFESTRQVSALDCDPWTNAQDGEISKPYTFTTLKAGKSEAVVRFKYTFATGSDRTASQTVLLTFQRLSPGAVWQAADFIMPNDASLLELLERNP